MSIRPLDIMMAITQSQTLKSPESDQTLKHAQQAQLLNDQNVKMKEVVTKIPEEENYMEIMDTIKQGMTDQQSEEQLPNNKHKNNTSIEETMERELLDDDNGQSIDIIG